MDYSASTRHLARFTCCPFATVLNYSQTVLACVSLLASSLRPATPRVAEARVVKSTVEAVPVGL